MRDRIAPTRTRRRAAVPMTTAPEPRAVPGDVRPAGSAALARAAHVARPSGAARVAGPR